jgi:spore germination protein
LLFAEVDVHSGALVRFNYYAACNSVNFDMENAELIAKDFLTSLGYENMTASWVSENGTDADFTFAPEKDGVRIDPDSVKVKICRERGVVTAMDASKYLKNHKTRSLEKPTLTKEQAQAYLNENVTVEKATLALVKTKRGEKTAYEFLCSYGEEKYLIYTDANTGNELAILNVKNR